MTEKASIGSRGAQQGRRLLLIAYKFPPMQSVSCNRTWALYQGLQKYFDEVFVITTSNRHLLPQDEMDVSDPRIFDALTHDYRTLFQKDKGAVASEKLKTSRFGKLLTRLQSSFPTMRWLGEGGHRYIRNGIRIGSELVPTQRITHLLSTFPPYADHLIAFGLKRKFPELRWIADFRDLHVDPAQDNLLARRYQLRQNTQILSAAQVVTTVSHGLAKHLSGIHPHVEVLKNGMRQEAGPMPQPFEKFTIAYTGSMFQDKRRPETLLHALRELLERGRISAETVQLIYAGKDAAVWHPLIAAEGLGQIFVDRGLRTTEEAREIQRRSHLNVLLTYSTDQLKGNLTGKLSDYLVARRPVMALINGPADPEVEAVMASTRYGSVVYHGDVEAAKASVERLYQMWIRGETCIESSFPAEYGWPAILEAFAGTQGWQQAVGV